MAPVLNNKRICLFADGTGNAFSTQETNIWRMYDALDKNDIRQISHYLPGVGTSGFRPWALIDSATGLGVPSNVRRLYEFLCWNYCPGDQIFVFGFSRGAFTIRVLIGLIDAEGLLSRTGRNGTVSRAEMRRNVMAAWRSYRSRRRPSFSHEAPTIKATRFVRDAMLRVKRWAARQESYEEIRKRSDHAAGIAFAGLFDTVEAYGVPVEEMRDAIDWAIWPIKFQDRTLGDKVVRARHALSLDDERQTFHPVRFDKAKESDKARIVEVWFAGTHSDVGGGYPDGALSLMPLDWMLGELDKAVELGEKKVTFREEWRQEVREGMSALAAAHDSRTGLAVFYRYAPRVIRVGAADGGPPRIHHSVIEKIAFGEDLYAPHSLPAEVDLLMPDGTTRPMAGFQPRAARSAGLLAAPPQAADETTVTEAAIGRVNSPDPGFVALVNDGVWLRRKAYFALLLTCLLIVVLPLIADGIAGWIGWDAAGDAAASRGDAPGGGTLAGVGGLAYAFGPVRGAIDGLGGLVRGFVDAFGGLVPGYLKPWVEVIARQPLICLAFILLAAALYGANGTLRDRIADDARCAWFASTTGAVARPGALLRGVGFLRRHLLARAPRRLAYWPVFVLTLAALFAAALLCLDRIGLGFASNSGWLCRFSDGPRQWPSPGKPAEAHGFSPSAPCWDSAIVVEKGRTYELGVAMTEPFLDRQVLADIAGFSDGSRPHRLATPLKRWPAQAYLQLIGRIGKTGGTEWPIRSLDGLEPLPLDGRAEVGVGNPADACSPSRPPPDAAERQRELGIRTRIRSRFTAARSGELFVYANDAIFASDLFAWAALVPRSDCFYRNNSGKADVTVTLVDDAKP